MLYILYLVRVSRDASDPLETEVEDWQRVARFGHEGNKEAAEAGVHVHPHTVVQP